MADALSPPLSQAGVLFRKRTPRCSAQSVQTDSCARSCKLLLPHEEICSDYLFSEKRSSSHALSHMSSPRDLCRLLQRKPPPLSSRTLTSSQVRRNLSIPAVVQSIRLCWTGSLTRTAICYNREVKHLQTVEVRGVHLCQSFSSGLRCLTNAVIDLGKMERSANTVITLLTSCAKQRTWA